MSNGEVIATLQQSPEKNTAEWWEQLRLSREEEARQRREESRQEALRQQKENPQDILKYCGVPSKHLASSFATFHGGEIAKQACLEAAKTIQSVLLSGSTGCGKTHLAVSILRHKITDSGQVFHSMIDYPARNKVKAVFITVPELLLQIRASYNRQNSGMTEEEIVDEYGSVSLLILDDLGSEKPSEWAESTLYLIIDRRNRENRWTIVTTNLTLEEIEARMGARIASRLSDMKVIRLKLPDYRKKRKEASAGDLA